MNKLICCAMPAAILVVGCANPVYAGGRKRAASRNVTRVSYSPSRDLTPVIPEISPFDAGRLLEHSRSDFYKQQQTPATGSSRLPASFDQALGEITDFDIEGERVAVGALRKLVSERRKECQKQLAQANAFITQAKAYSVGLTKGIANYSESRTSFRNCAATARYENIASGDSAVSKLSGFLAARLQNEDKLIEASVTHMRERIDYIEALFDFYARTEATLQQWPENSIDAGPILAGLEALDAGLNRVTSSLDSFNETLERTMPPETIRHEHQVETVDSYRNNDQQQSAIFVSKIEPRSRAVIVTDIQARNAAPRVAARNPVFRGNERERRASLLQALAGKSVWDLAREKR